VNIFANLNSHEKQVKLIKIFLKIRRNNLGTLCVFHLDELSAVLNLILLIVKKVSFSYNLVGITGSELF